MQVAISPPPWEGPVRWISWPDEWRIPVAGELLILNEAEDWRVASVQWELPADSNDVIVHLRMERVG